MILITVLAALAFVLSPQQPSTAEKDLTRVMDAVRSAVAPALPFPASDDAGAVPADGQSTNPWMVRPLQPGDRVIEVIANPLNEANQARATRAMAQIEASIQSAQRRADLQYERAVAEAKRTGKSQDVDGVTLSDEGLAGARIDAESHLSIAVAFNEPSYKFSLRSSVEPAALTQVSIPGGSVISVPSNTFRDERGDERFCEAESFIYLGRLTTEVRKGDGAEYQVSAVATASETAGPTMVVHLRGNEVLIADILRKTNWSALAELLR